MRHPRHRHRVRATSRARSAGPAGWPATQEDTAGARNPTRGASHTPSATASARSTAVCKPLSKSTASSGRGNRASLTFRVGSSAQTTATTPGMPSSHKAPPSRHLPGCAWSMCRISTGGLVHSHGLALAQPRIKASMASASTGTSRVISSQPASVTTASSSMRIPMFENCSGTPSAGRTYSPGSMVSTMPGRSTRLGGW